MFARTCPNAPSVPAERFALTNRSREGYDEGKRECRLRAGQKEEEDDGEQDGAGEWFSARAEESCMKKAMAFFLSVTAFAALLFSGAAAADPFVRNGGWEGSCAADASDTDSAAEPVPEEILTLPAGTILDSTDFGKEEESQYFSASGIHEDGCIFQRINGKSYRQNDDISLEDLRYLKVLFRNFEGETEVGEMIVNRAIADDTLDVFHALYDASYPIRKIHLVDEYWKTDGATADEASMEDDNTSAFNYRTMTNSDKLSNHALGYAIDLNPLENPYVRQEDDGFSVSPDTAEARSYADRQNMRPYMIDSRDKAYLEFTAHGFTWGGDWSNPKDYQHFEKSAGHDPENASGRGTASAESD